MKRYAISYGFDVPYYADFTVEAKNEKEALKIARQALHDGRFSGVAGNPCFDNSGNERVFSLGVAREQDASPTMDELEGIEPKKETE